MNADQRIYLSSILITFVVLIAVAWWWMPQKWSACQKLYDNKPAQVFCLLSR